MLPLILRPFLRASHLCSQETTRKALAVAMAMNRFLILPRVTCFCDRWVPACLPACLPAWEMVSQPVVMLYRTSDALQLQ